MFNGIPSGWQVVLVKDLIEGHVSGPSPTCEERNIQSESEWGVLKTTAVKWSGYNEFAHKTLPPSYWGLKHLEVQAGDVLVTKAGPRHRVGVVVHVSSTQPRLIVSGKMIKLRLKAEYRESDVIAGLLSQVGPQKYLDDRSTGMAESQVNFTNTVLLNTPLLLPSKGERAQISEIGQQLDTQIQKNEAIIAKLQQVKQGLLHDLLTRGVDANGQLRPFREQAPELYKESPLGWIPVEWEVVRLGDVATRSAGVLQTGPFGAQLHAHEYVSEGVPVVMPQDLNDENIDTTKIAHITESRACSLGKHRVMKNDVVFSRRGDLSRCVAITENESGWVCGTGCLLARFTEDEIIGQWLSLSYKQQCSQSQIQGMAVGSTMPNLNTGILSKLLIARPTAVEQKAILTLYKSSSDRYIIEQRALAKLMKQKSGLMDDLLTGRVRVNHLTS